MEEKEGTASGSIGNSETDSPSPVSSVVIPPVTNMDMNIVAENMGMERSISVTRTPTTLGSSGGSGWQENGGLDLFGKKKRGRPRKYDLDGNLAVQPFHHTTSGFCSSFSTPSGHLLSSSKRGRGRPPGSGNWQLLASLGELFANTAGGDFTPHVLTVNTGEDVAGKILSLAQKGPRGICVLAANGAVSDVTIRQPGSSGGILTYEGRFEILTLTGSFTASEAGGVRNRTGGLSISLASPDGRVIGGGIAGLLLAASPIQIVLGSFMPNGFKAHKRKHHREQRMASVIPETKPDGETCLTLAYPVTAQGNVGTDTSENGKKITEAMDSQGACSNGTETTSDQRPSPDINISLPSEEDVQVFISGLF